MKTAKPFDRTQVFEAAEREATHVALSELNLAEAWLNEQRDEAPAQLVHEGSRWDLSEDVMISLIDSHERDLPHFLIMDFHAEKYGSREASDPVMSDDYVLLDVLDGDLTEDDRDLRSDAERAEDEYWLDEHRYDNYLHEEELFGDVEAPSLTFEEAMAQRQLRINHGLDETESDDTQGEDDWSEFDQPATPRTHGQLRRESYLLSVEEQHEAVRGKPDHSRQNRRRNRRRDTIRRAA